MPTTKLSKSNRVKGGKGKKDGKHESKPDKESDLEAARVNAALWELKLKISNQDLVEYREAHHELARVNEQLSNQLSRAEMDSISATGYWQKEVEHREEQIRNLKEDLKRQKALALEEKNTMAQDFQKLQNKMKKLEEVNAQLEMDLSDMRKSMDIAEQNYRENLKKTKDELTEEKVSLKKEMEGQCNLKIAKLMLDHHETVTQLKGALNSASMEHHRLNEALKNTLKEAENLKKLTHSLAEENLSLRLEKDMLELIVKQNTEEMEARKKQLSELLAKKASLEQALEKMEVKLELQEKKETMNLITIQASQVELDKLQKVLTMREKEIKHVKQLAATILKKRKEVERFFHEALDHVREEIAASRLQFKKEALQEYQQKFREATAGMIKFPPICTFNNNPNSTKSVYTDMEAAETWPHPPGNEVQISDLTWEQKEKVLSLLFAKMNGLA